MIGSSVRRLSAKQACIVTCMSWMEGIPNLHRAFSHHDAVRARDFMLSAAEHHHSCWIENDSIAMLP